MIQYTCPMCGMRLQNPPSTAGKMDECPECGHASMVPKSSNPGLIAFAAGGVVAVGVLLGTVLWMRSARDKPAPPPAEVAVGELDVRPAPKPESKPAPEPAPERKPASKPAPKPAPEPEPKSDPKPTPAKKPAPLAPESRPKSTSKPVRDAGPVWTKIVLDGEFSSDGKVWKVAESVYSAAAGLVGGGTPTALWGMTAGVDNAGLTVAQFRTRYGTGEIKTAASGNGESITYYVFGPLRLGFRPGQERFTWLMAPVRFYTSGFEKMARETAGKQGDQ